MLRIYALDPEVASNDVTAFALFVNGLGVDNGRLMAEFPKRWRAMAIDGVQRIQSVLEAKRAEVLLTELATNPTLRTRLALPFEPANTWLENALQHQTAFAAVISTDEQSAQDSTHAAQAASSLLTAAPFWRADRYVEFKSHPEAFAQLLKPLIQLADEAVFMDPFFDAQQDRYIKSLKAILSAAPNLKRVVIHGTRKASMQGGPTAKDGRNLTRDRLRSLMRPDLQFTVATWQGMGPTEAPHHRWVATPIGAVTLDRGFGSDGKANNCQALPREAAAMKWATFSQTPYSDSPYEFVDEVTLLGE